MNAGLVYQDKFVATFLDMFFELFKIFFSGRGEGEAT